jgi:hypothetical protein
MSKVLGPRNPVMPAFINIGQRVEGIGESEELKAFTTAGFFRDRIWPHESSFRRRLRSPYVRPQEWNQVDLKTATNSTRSWWTRCPAGNPE